MLFNSLEFLVFFPLVTILFFCLEHKYRWALLLISSCIFYMMFKPEYILIIFVTIIIDFYIGIQIEKTADAVKRKRYLVISIVANVGILCIFKYFNFINDNITGLVSLMGYDNPIPYLDIILPIGLSFHTFQAMSYTAEVYRGKQPAERNIGIYSLYVMFYPQMVAGPIERPQNLLHQFREKKYFDYYRVADGLRLMAWGMFKKVAIADQVGLMVNQVYDDPFKYEGLPLVIATILFGVQIYCDFSGYSDIAIGAARVMGFKMMKNFDRPYSSNSVSEFWRRWHISLSTWFNDYLFTPLATDKRAWGNLGIAFAVAVTFLLSGLWHGAGWTFILFGALHGTLMIYEVLTRKWRKKIGRKTPAWIYTPFTWLLTYSFVTMSWIFFRSADIDSAWHIVKNAFNHIGSDIVKVATDSAAREKLLYLIPDKWALKPQDHWTFWCSAALIFFMFLIEHIQRTSEPERILEGRPSWVRWSWYYLFILVILLFGNWSKSAFIYFQF